MYTCLEQERDDTVRWGLADNKRCHHVERRRRGHPQTLRFLETNSEDVRLDRDVAERVDGSGQKSE